MDMFETKNIKPMLIGAEGEPFDDPNYIFELKLDGERCVAYLDSSGTELRNKRNNRMLPKFPELSDIHKQVKKRCILDGELMVSVDGKPDFDEVKRRSLMSNKFKIDLAHAKYPATFVAFDILYIDGVDITHRPLMERKKILQDVIKKENARLALSRFIENQGTALYQLAEQQDLEGVAAKRKESIYIPSKRTRDWIKIKNLKDDDYVVCGYIPKENNVVSIVLGQYNVDGKLKYKGHVTLGVSRQDFARIQKVKSRKTSPIVDVPKGNEYAVWLAPTLVCTVKYMQKHESGTLRQPVFKCLRDDKEPRECTDEQTRIL